MQRWFTEIAQIQWNFQRISKYNGKLFTQLKKKLSMFALGSLGRQNMYLCSSTKLKTKENFILIKITFNINF